jgi:hypothetical protein
MGMLDRLRAAHPDLDIIAFDGHYRRIGDADTGILSHISVAKGARTTTIRAEEPGRRKPLKPKGVEARLTRLLGEFAQAA